MLRDGVVELRVPVEARLLRERLVDVLTDAIRASILRLCGYRVDAVEFVSDEHTPRNLLLRAVRTGASHGAAARAKGMTDEMLRWQTERFTALAVSALTGAPRCSIRGMPSGRLSGGVSSMLRFGSGVFVGALPRPAGKKSRRAVTHPPMDYFGRLAPYFERDCLRSLTPCRSSEPRTMW